MDNFDDLMKGVAVGVTSEGALKVLNATEMGLGIALLNSNSQEATYLLLKAWIFNLRVAEWDSWDTC